MASTDKRKNVLLILTDQQRFDTLGCYGAPTCRTPHIDGIAERGVRFESAFCATSPCSPSRASLFTGLYPHKTHVPQNGDELNRDVPNLGWELQKAGYSLGYSGKWHVDRHYVPSDYGFEGKDFPLYGYPPTHGFVEGLRYMQNNDMPPHYNEWLKKRGLEPPKVLEAYYGENPTKQNQEMYALQSGTIESSFETMVADFCIDLLKQFKESRDQEGKPFFIWANFWGPHTPCFIPEPYYSMYDPEKIEPDPSFFESWRNKPGAHEMYERYWGLRDGGWDAWRRIVARYWGYCTMIDDLVGRMLDALKDLGMADDTIVIYGTDHGDQMGAHRMIEKGPFAYEETWRLPLVVSHPDCEAPGSTSDEFVYLFDLFPTILEEAGITPPDVPDSQSIRENILGRDAPTGRDSVYCTFAGHILPASLCFVRDQRYKLVYNQADIGELYDLETDPYELNNLIDSPEAAEVKAELGEKLAQHLERVGDPKAGGWNGLRYVY